MFSLTVNLRNKHLSIWSIASRKCEFSFLRGVTSRVVKVKEWNFQVFFVGRIPIVQLHLIDSLYDLSSILGMICTLCVADRARSINLIKMNDSLECGIIIGSAVLSYLAHYWSHYVNWKWTAKANEAWSRRQIRRSANIRYCEDNT